MASSSQRSTAFVDGSLTAPSLYTLDYIGPPAHLSAYVTTFYHFRCDEDEVRDIQPAAVGHLVLFPRGQGHMHIPDGAPDASYQTNLMTPFSQAVPFVVAGPFHAIGAALTPMGWAALTGLDASANGNRLLDAGTVLGEDVTDLGARLCSAYCSGEKDGAAIAHALGEFIRDHLQPVNSRHAGLISQVNSWLGSSIRPPLADLYAEAAYSKRQVQRLVERYFGVGPQELARKYRALRAAATLSLPTLSDEAEAEIKNAFYDESHMIRELRHFVGRTPKRLGNGMGPLVNELVAEQNLRELPRGDAD